MKTSHLESLFANLENGNLTDAKRQAKRHSFLDLFMFARDELCKPYKWSAETAAYLKGKCTFQQYCDACQNAREGVR